MNMLAMNEAQMKVFEQLQFQKLKQQIAHELSERIEDWKQFDAKKQSQLVDFLFSEASNAKMVYEIEYILFALICMSAQDDCQTFLGRSDVESILLNEKLDNKEKLIKMAIFTTIEINKNNKGWVIKRRESSE